MKRKLLLALSILALAGCSSTPQPDSGGQTTFNPPPPQPEQQAPQQSHREIAPSPPRTNPAARPLASADQCGAADLQYLVGRPRTEIPVPLQPDKRRVVCSSCAVTQDFRPDRQTIVFDTDTGVIKSVTCG